MEVGQTLRKHAPTKWPGNEAAQFRSQLTAFEIRSRSRSPIFARNALQFLLGDRAGMPAIASRRGSMQPTDRDLCRPAGSNSRLMNDARCAFIRPLSFRGDIYCPGRARSRPAGSAL